MKKLLVVSIALYVICLATSAFAATSVETDLDASASGVFSIELMPINASYATNGLGLNFSVTAADYTANYKDADEHETGKSDLGLKCKSNSGSAWYVKMKIADTTNDLGATVGVYRYCSGGYLSGTKTDGTVTGEGVWTLIPVHPTQGLLYSSGTVDAVTYDTQLGISVGLQDLTKLNASKTYASTVTYTITTTP